METTPVEEEYVVVTAISSFRHRYVIPMSELQKMNESDKVNPTWAADCVTMNEVKEFSQEHLGESISDVMVMQEEALLKLFDDDNKYLSGWDKEQKLTWIQNWKETLE